MKRILLKPKIQVSHLVLLVQRGVATDEIEKVLEIDVDFGEGVVFTLTGEHITAKDVWALVTEFAKPSVTRPREILAEDIGLSP